MTVGTHTVTVTPPGGGDPVDVSCLVEQVTVTQGRGDTTTQPEAATATVDLDLEADWLPEAVEIGALLTVQTQLTAGPPLTRFCGPISDITLGWDDAGVDTPNAGTGQLIATATLADLGRRVIGDQPWPQELDGARVTRILTLAGMPATTANVDPGAVQILPRDVDSTDALQLAQDTAGNAGGIVWQTRDGLVCYADARHRHNLPVDLALDVCQILVTPAWSKTLQGLTNKVSVGYGIPAGQDADQPRYVAQADASIGRYGVFDYSIATQLAALADAQALAGLLLARNSTPVWVMTSLPVDVADLPEPDTVTLLGLEMHSLIALSGLPIIAPGAPTNALLWVEGWAETLTADGHALELVVSGYCRTVPPPLWDDTDPGWTWDTLDPALTWDGAACLGPPVRDDRWADVPASTRWDNVPAGTTWDTWPPTL